MFWNTFILQLEKTTRHGILLLPPPTSHPWGIHQKQIKTHTCAGNKKQLVLLDNMVLGAEAPLVFTVTNLNAVKIFNTLTQSCFLCTESVIWVFKKELSFPGTLQFKMVSVCSEKPSTVQQDCCKTTLFHILEKQQQKHLTKKIFLFYWHYKVSWSTDTLSLFSSIYKDIMNN